MLSIYIENDYERLSHETGHAYLLLDAVSDGAHYDMGFLLIVLLWKNSCVI